jgi:integrase
MACVRQRRGVYVLDYRQHGHRVAKTYRTKRLALAALKKLARKKQRSLNPSIDPLVTVAGYVSRFLTDCTEAEAAPRTLEAYAAVLSNHVVPRIGPLKVADVSRVDVRGLLLTLGREAVSVQGQKGAERAGRKGLSRNSIRQVRTLLSAFFDSAIRDELREDNPAHNVFRKSRTKTARMKARPRVGESVKAMTATERDRFLTAALAIAPQWFTAWTLMALAGLRRNEALGLRWGSVRLAARQIVVREQLHAGSTKSGEVRVVDLAEPLAEHLRVLRGRLREEAFRRCEPLDERERVCCSGLPDQLTRRQVQTTISRPTRAMRRVLKRAGLPGHFTMHSLRHSFCSLLISSGVSPVYVQQQAGHADVSFTVRVYGSWFPAVAPGAMDRLAADASYLPRTKAVTNGAIPVTTASGPSPQTLEPTGTTPRPASDGPPSP